MKIAVISDIHSNLVALEAVMDSIRSEGVDQVVCLGDVVGYGARPNECVEVIRSNEIPCILGNHDEAAIGLGDINYFNQWAREAILWTSVNLNEKSREFLMGLKLTYEIEDILFVHASPYEPKAWHYIFSEYEARLSFSSFKQRVCFIGHTHIPAVFSEPDGRRRIINVGSVGQPRDHDPKACWELYEIDPENSKLVRVEYDVEQSSSQIISGGLPGFLADRLKSGI